MLAVSGGRAGLKRKDRALLQSFVKRFGAAAN